MTGFSTLRRFVLSAVVLGFAAHAAAQAPLTLDVYNPGEAAIFPVSSVLISGDKDAILVDAQFGKAQAQQVVDKVRASGKNLTTIYISHGDPDYYFGLENPDPGISRRQGRGLGADRCTYQRNQRR